MFGNRLHPFVGDVGPGDAFIIGADDHRYAEADVVPQGVVGPGDPEDRAVARRLISTAMRLSASVSKSPSGGPPGCVASAPIITPCPKVGRKRLPNPQHCVGKPGTARRHLRGTASGFFDRDKLIWQCPTLRFPCEIRSGFATAGESAFRISDRIPLDREVGNGVLSTLARIIDDE